MCMCVTVVIKSVIWGYYSLLEALSLFLFFLSASHSVAHFGLNVQTELRAGTWTELTAQRAWRMECLHSRGFDRKSASPRVHSNGLFPHHSERSTIVIHNPNTKDSICSDRSDYFLHYSFGAQLISHRELCQCSMQHRLFFYPHAFFNILDLFCEIKRFIVSILVPDCKGKRWKHCVHSSAHKTWNSAEWQHTIVWVL